MTVNGMYVAEQPPHVLLDTILNSQQVLVTLGAHPSERIQLCLAYKNITSPSKTGWPRQCSAYGGVTGYHSIGNGSLQDNNQLYGGKQESKVIETSSYSLGTGLQAASWCVIASN